MEAALTDDERAQARGEPPLRQAVVSTDGAVPAAYRVRDGIDFYLQPLGDKRAMGEFSDDAIHESGAHERARHLLPVPNS